MDDMGAGERFPWIGFMHMSSAFLLAPDWMVGEVMHVLFFCFLFLPALQMKRLSFCNDLPIREMQNI
jgi:hypothetical protein